MSPAAFLESYSVQVNLYLRLYANDDPYEASSNKDISFNLCLFAALYKIHKSDDNLKNGFFLK